MHALLIRCSSSTSLVISNAARRVRNVHSADGWHDALDPVIAAIAARSRASTFAPTQPSPCQGFTSTWKNKRIKYAIRLLVNRVLQERIGHLLKRPVGRPPTMSAGFTRASATRPEAGRRRAG